MKLTAAIRLPLALAVVAEMLFRPLADGRIAVPAVQAVRFTSQVLPERLPVSSSFLHEAVSSARAAAAKAAFLTGIINGLLRTLVRT